jgi:hypothetical protein
MFRSRILAAIVAVWGAVVVVRLLVNGTDGDGAYSTGQYAAGFIALVMVVLGVRAVLNSRAS